MLGHGLDNGFRVSRHLEIDAGIDGRSEGAVQDGRGKDQETCMVISVAMEANFSFRSLSFTLDEAIRTYVVRY